MRQFLKLVFLLQPVALDLVAFAEKIFNGFHFCAVCTSFIAITFCFSPNKFIFINQAVFNSFFTNLLFLIHMLLYLFNRCSVFSTNDIYLES